MVDVLLAHSNHLFHGRKQVQMQPCPTLQTLLAAVLLRGNGISVALCDVTLDPPEKKFETHLDSCARGKLVACEDDFNFLAKMCLGRNRELSFRIVQMASKSGIPAAVGSSKSSDNVPDYLAAGFDYGLVDNRRGVVGQNAVERHADEFLRCEMVSDPDPLRIHAAREALRETRAAGEA
jgi:anaerobic magnesium-protoporphyrin IX monomethyl ester cyclase